MTENRIERDSGKRLYAQIVDSIMEQIHAGTFSFDVPICTEAELMERFGVSRITVRHALTQLENQGVLYRKRGVGSFVNPDIYQTPISGAELAPAKSNRVFAFVIPFNIARTGLTGSIQEATNYLNERDCFTSMYISGENGENQGHCILQRLAQMNIAGVAYYPYTNNIHLEALNELMFSGKPVVLMDLPSRVAHLPSVTSDNLGGERALIRHLTSLGHRHIAFLSGIPISARETLGDRYSGYLLGLADAGIKLNPALVYTEMGPEARALPAEAAGSMASVIRALRENGATAIVCEHDEIAYYVLQSCRELRLRVPEDISVCGFDDNEWATMLPDRHTTTIAQDWAAIGRTVAELLYAGTENPMSVHSPVVIPTRFVQGNTTGPAPADLA